MIVYLVSMEDSYLLGKKNVRWSSRRKMFIIILYRIWLFKL